jgi:hypothetical protein
MGILRAAWAKIEAGFEQRRKEADTQPETSRQIERLGPEKVTQ